MRVYYITNNTRTELYWARVEDFRQTDFVNRINSVYGKSFRVRDVPGSVTVGSASDLRNYANTNARIIQVR